MRLTRDHVAVLYHDHRCQIPGEGSFGVRELDFNRLKTLDIGGGEQDPALKTLFERYGDKLSFDLELKEIDAAQEVVKLLDEFDMHGRVIISSFIPEALQMAYDLASDVPRGLLVDRLAGRLSGGRNAVRAAGLLKCRYILPHAGLVNREWISEAASEGLKTIAWTVNRFDEGQKLLNMGIDGLISDKPDIFQAIVSNGRSELPSNQ